tara:strand:- start:2755 stop:2982 length:228 start_codon:yes stop_codon:yes gene_type:complete
MYIVCYTTQRESKNLLPNEVEYHSDWMAFDTLEEAQEEYRKLFRRKNLYTATICKPIESTEPTYLDESKEEECPF